MAAVGESAPDEEPGVDASNQSVKENRPNNLDDAENEPAMLDEEEMPSFVSLTSLPIPEDAKTGENVVRESEETKPGLERASSPYTSEHGADSVCVLSSGEESDRRPYERMEDYDSDEMDMEEEEEEEDEEEDDSCGNDDEDESEGDIETEQFERSSDDFVLRYDSGLEKHHKERSRSLQDLTNARGNLSRFVGKRRSIDLMGSNEPEFFRNNLQSVEDPLLLRKKMPRSVKYDHVPSKVKLYIQEMKEQRRRSAERLNREMPSQKNAIDFAKSRGDNVDSRSRQNSSKTLKSYVQNAINEMKMNDFTSDDRTNQERAQFTGIHKIHDIKETNETEIIPPSDAIPQNLTRTSENPTKKLKSNGLVDYDDEERARESVKISESNGPPEIPAIFNVRSLNYEEYTNGIETPKEIMENLLSAPKIEKNNEATEYTEQLFVSELQTEAPTRKEDEITARARPIDGSESRETWNLRELTFDEPRRKIAQVDREVYQQTIDENNSMRRELEEMRKMFEQYRCDNPPVEEYEKVVAENTTLKRKLADITNEFDAYKAKNVPAEKKVVAVQTDPDNDEKTDPTVEQSKQESATNKILSSTVTSALSSIEVWSDSNCSPAISIDPPNIEAALNSDDSLAAGERPAPKTPRQLSHSFVTSSRILQTLASITQGRSRPAKASPSNVKRDDSHSNLEQGQSKRQMLDSILTGNDDAYSPRARKRKASDMLGASSNAPESFKIPYTPGDTRWKISSDSAADGARKADQRSAIADKYDKRNDDDTERPADHREDNADIDDAPKNVKYFVYHDEPDSKERSFLIQADDSGKNEETIDRGGHVRECGPFLLGNVEIRMTETNGTINIWGKEINQSTDDAEVDVGMEDSEVHDRSFVPRSSFVCQSTPHHKCQSVNASACTSHKRARLSPKFGRSGIGKYLRSAGTSMSRSNSFNNTNNFEQCIPENNRTMNCEHCDSHEKRSRVSSCEENNINSRVKQQRGCCIKNIEMNEKDCDCIGDKEIFDDSAIYENMSNILAKHEKCTNSLSNALSKHVCVNYFNEDITKNHATHCRNSLGRDDDFNQTKKRSSCFNDSPSCSTRLVAGSHTCHENTSHSHNHFSCEDDDHHLISPDREHCETLQTKRRRLSGKKVRGILTDLLRGCGGGGCREQNSTSSLPRPNLSKVIPKIQLTPCSPLQSSSSKRPNPHSCQLNHLSNETITDKCCNSCTRRAEMRAQIENQLEIFQAAMEQLRTRSDSVLEMLHLLKAETD